MTAEEMAMAMRVASQRVGMSGPEGWGEISERRRQQWRDIAHALRVDGLELVRTQIASESGYGVIVPSVRMVGDEAE